MAGEDFTSVFADTGERQPINMTQWLAGWLAIVGGLNGVPTSEQFNTFGYMLESKTNLAGNIAVAARELAEYLQQVINEHIGSNGETNHALATQLVAGFLSANDKKKLDNLHSFFEWIPNTAYQVGDICFSPRAASYKRFECVAAGTSGAVEPTWPGIGVMIQDNTVKWIVDDVRDGTPYGGTRNEHRTTPRPGYLEKDGTLKSRAEFPRLWRYANECGLLVPDADWVSGNLFGYFSTGDGSTTFRIPEQRGEHERGWDHGRGVDPGRGVGTWQNFAVQSHSHHLIVPKAGGGGGQGVQNGPPDGLKIELDTQATGGSETRGRNVALLSCIKY